MKQFRISNRITSRESDSIKLYFGDISKIKLLDSEQEVNLAEKIKKGDENALQKLVESNLRFVISVAKQYQNKGIILEDLINEGNIGLIKAAKKFDSSKGFKFISYAVWWIRQSILQALAENSKVIRVPTNQLISVNKINQVLVKLQQQFEREPTIEEISVEIQEKEEKVRELLSLNKSAVSMDAPINKENDTNYYEIIPSEEPNLYEQKFNEDAFRKDLEKVIDKLKPREKRILCMYFGLLGHQAMTLEEIGDYFELTRERVRQIKDNAIRALRIRDRSNVLKQYYG